MGVGPDTTTLPVRLLGDATNPPPFLVLSADAETVTALDEKGDTRWEYRLSRACLGRPVIVEQRAFLATYDGVIHEIELIGGKRLGRYELGTPGHGPRTVDRRHPPGGPDLVYFPADDTCVYVLDVAKRECKTILYTNHPQRRAPQRAAGGRSRGPRDAGLPDPQPDGRPGRDGVARVLPADREPQRRPGGIEGPPRVRGWSWFPPYQDGEKGPPDRRGRPGAVGICQAHHRDPALYPRFPAGPGGEQPGPVPVSPGGPREAGGPAGRGPGPGPGGPRAGRRLLGAG